eukprot:3200700-Lingulodinium_polyedra.AAC.1
MCWCACKTGALSRTVEGLSCRRRHRQPTPIARTPFSASIARARVFGKGLSCADLSDGAPRALRFSILPGAQASPRTWMHLAR